MKIIIVTLFNLFYYIKLNCNVLFSNAHLLYMIIYLKQLHLVSLQSSDVHQILLICDRSNFNIYYLLSTCVMSIVLFVRLFNFVLLQARTGCSVRYCVLTVLYGIVF